VGRMKTKNDDRCHHSSSGCHVAASDVAPGLDGKKGVRGGVTDTDLTMLYVVTVITAMHRSGRRSFSCHVGDVTLRCRSCCVEAWCHCCGW
jgi:hypothetical protein